MMAQDGLLVRRMGKICIFAASIINIMINMTQKEAIIKALEDLGGRGRLQDIYPLAMEYGDFSGSKTPKATIRNYLLMSPKSFRRSYGKPNGWWELLSYQEEMSALKKENEMLLKTINESITLEQIIDGFNEMVTLDDRLDARSMFNDMFTDHPAWKKVRKMLKEKGYFSKEKMPTIINNPVFKGPMNDIHDNKEVKL